MHLSIIISPYGIEKMICQRKNIDQRFFIWMNAFDDFDRLIHQLPLAIDFYLVLDSLADLADLPFKWICPFQWTVITLYGIDCHTMIVIPDPPHSNFCEFIPYLQGIFLRDEYLEFYIGKVFHGTCLTPFIVLDHGPWSIVHRL